MAKTPIHRTYYEGDDDGAVLRALAKASLLPSDLQIVPRDDRQKNPGKDGMVKDLVALVNPSGGAGLSAVAVRDIDDLSHDQVRDWFVQKMNSELPPSTPAVQLNVQAGTVKVSLIRLEVTGLAHAGRAVVVSAGLAGGAAAKNYGVSQFAIDDYVLLLAREKSVYESVSEFSEAGYDLAMKKLSEITQLMQNNGIPIKHTKRLMHVLRAVTGFRASPAAFADRLVTQAVATLGLAQVRSLFLPLIESLEEASKILTP